MDPPYVACLTRCEFGPAEIESLLGCFGAVAGCLANEVGRPLKLVV